MNKNTKYIKKIYNEIFNIPPTKNQIQDGLLFLQKHKIAELINTLIIKKYKTKLDLCKKYKKKYKELKEMKITEYELIQLSKQYKDVLDKKDTEIQRLKSDRYNSFYSSYSMPFGSFDNYD